MDKFIFHYKTCFRTTNRAKIQSFHFKGLRGCIQDWVFLWDKWTSPKITKHTTKQNPQIGPATRAFCSHEFVQILCQHFINFVQFVCCEIFPCREEQCRNSLAMLLTVAPFGVHAQVSFSYESSPLVVFYDHPLESNTLRARENTLTTKKTKNVVFNCGQLVENTSVHILPQFPIRYDKQMFKSF